MLNIQMNCKTVSFVAWYNYSHRKNHIPDALSDYEGENNNGYEGNDNTNVLNIFGKCQSN